MPHWIEAELATLAFCWRLDRRDGVALGFTSHDRDLLIDGFRYRASPGLVPSAIERGTGLDTGGVDLSGMLTSDAIREEDLIAGRWDGARIALMAVDWQAPDADPVRLIAGLLGTVRMTGQAFDVSLVGAPAQLDRPASPATSPDCRAMLGDKNCRIDLAGRTQMVIVTGHIGSSIAVSGALAANAFGDGQLRWLDGANAGLSALILSNDTQQLVLAEPPSLPVTAGDRAEIVQGCDRRFATCTTRFGNAVNFRGEPHLPGNDLLTRYAS